MAKKNILLIDVFAIYVGRGRIRNNSILVYSVDDYDSVRVWIPVGSMPAGPAS